MTSIAFLLGTKPDACILVVNGIDEEAYVQDSIDGIRALCKAPTLALAMSDVEKHVQSVYGRTIIRRRSMDPVEVRAKLQQFETRFGVPAFSILSAADQERLLDLVIDHFAKDG